MARLGAFVDTIQEDLLGRPTTKDALLLQLLHRCGSSFHRYKVVLICAMSALTSSCGRAADETEDEQPAKFGMQLWPASAHGENGE